MPYAGEQYENVPNNYIGFTYNGSVWGNNCTIVYTGYMYIPTGVTTVEFAGNIDDGWWMSFNNVARVGWGWGQNTGDITVTPNTWYPVEFRFQNGGGGAGAAGGNNWEGALNAAKLPTGTTSVPTAWDSCAWEMGFGYQFNPTNGGDNTGTDYTLPLDNGTNNLFEVQDHISNLTGTITMGTGGATIASDAGTLF